MIITLTGFMGVGKSTIASSLAKHLYCKHKDLDKYIEALNGGTSIKELFNNLGEEIFRKQEEQALVSLLSENREKVLVLALGGGALLSPHNRELIKNNTFCIYLKASLDTLTRRLHSSYKTRPLVKDMDGTIDQKTIETLFIEREPGYLSTSAVTIDVDNLSPKGILKKIMSVL